MKARILSELKNIKTSNLVAGGVLGTVVNTLIFKIPFPASVLISAVVVGGVALYCKSSNKQ